MIFSIDGHIEKIINRSKTMTRRASSKYQENKLYTIQAKRGAKGISEGKIFITLKFEEFKNPNNFKFFPPAMAPISSWEAKAEGGYTPFEYEKLYEEMYPNWWIRYCYYFTYFDNKILERMRMKLK